MASQTELQDDVFDTNATITRSLIGKAKLNLAKRTLDFQFGSFNPRPLNDDHVTGLANAFESQGVNAFRADALLNLIVPSSICVEARSLTNDMSVIDPPELILTKQGRREMKVLDFLSGQHRVAALAKLHKKYRDDIEKLKKKQSGLSKGSAKYLEFDQTIKEKEALIESTSWWGVMVYNGSESNFPCLK
jgi:hypothetical protein